MQSRQTHCYNAYKINEILKRQKEKSIIQQTSKKVNERQTKVENKISLLNVLYTVGIKFQQSIKF